MSGHSTLTDLLTKARQRCVKHVLTDYLVKTLAIGLAFAAVILLIGTEFLSGFWLILVVICGAAVGLWLARKKFPSTYEVAQRIDARLHLADSLSTASYFSASPDAADASIRAAQWQHAEQLASSVDLKQALPLARSRSFYVACALALVVAGIFLLRYAIQGSFDPHPSLMKSAFDNFFSGPKTQALTGKSADENRPTDGTQQQAENKNTDFAGDPSKEFNPAAPEPQSPPNMDSKDKQADSKSGASNSPGNQENKEGEKTDDQKQNQDSNQNSPQDAKANPDPSLLDKVREAVNDLMNKMKSPNDSAQNQKGQPQSESEQQPGQDGQSKDKSQGDSTDAQNSSQQSSDGEKGKSSAQSKNSKDPQQGFGSQEGDKSAKLAAEMKAMGKISELVGKRAENIKGAVTIEVGKTKQQLQTPLSQRAAGHSEAGSEIHRDEVPPIYEQFVQKYFEQVRKSGSNSTVSETSPTAEIKPASPNASKP